MFSHRLNSSQARTANYEVLLRILNDCLQGNVAGTRLPVWRHQHISRGSPPGSFQLRGTGDPPGDNAFAKTGLKDFSGPVIRLHNLSPEDLFVLLHNIRTRLRSRRPGEISDRRRGDQAVHEPLRLDPGSRFLSHAARCREGLCRIVVGDRAESRHELEDALNQTVIDRSVDPEAGPPDPDEEQPTGMTPPKPGDDLASFHFRLCDIMAPEAPPKAFDRLHPSLQEALYRMRWTKLRQIQVDAIHEVFDGTGDLIIAARTAAGKTEAAFLPILSRMLEKPSAGIRAVYVGPLKALINDQFSRLEELCQEAEIPVHKWHGDVSSSPKRRLLEQPSGVLLITPESIESLFVNHAQRLTSVFSALGFIVIDELHSFIGTERGAHLRSLVCRLAAKSREPVRRAGLSATLGPEIDSARRWLRPSEPDGVRLSKPREEIHPVEDFGVFEASRPQKAAKRRETRTTRSRSKATSNETFSRPFTARPL